MRSRKLSSFMPAGVLALIFVGVPALAQDFDPNGRHKHPTPPAHPTGHATGHPTAPHPSGSGTGASPDAGTSNAVLIDRYTKVVLSQPGSPFPLQRLAQLYRDRDGNLQKLVAEFEARAATANAEQYASTVTLAGIYKIDGRIDDAVKTLQKANAQKATDPAAILALANLLKDRGDNDTARKRFEQGLALQTALPDREQTLRTLMGIALDAKDWAGAKGYHQS
ncbi:MAG: tetratricopeptide repeat protein, partial [Polyangiaceae bacterium]